MNHREACLVADRMKAPDLGDVHLILRSEPPGNLDRSRRHVQVERCPRAPEVGPLRHRFKVVDGLGGLHLDRSHQLVPAVGGREDEIRENHHLTDPHWYRLIFTDVRYHIMTTLESDLQQSNDTVVLQLLANRANQYRAHVTSTRENIWKGLGKRTANYNVSCRQLYSETVRNLARP